MLNIFVKDPQLAVIAAAKENSSFLAQKRENVIRESCSSYQFSRLFSPKEFDKGEKE